jgi:3-hydroxyacyl-[acyl-carrier-protein] dehydratase
MVTVTDLIPHRPPWLLVDRVVDDGADGVRCEKRLSKGDPLLDLDGGLPELLLVEALAQAAACLNARTHGAHRGLLVAVRGFAFHGRARAGETVALEVRQIAALGALRRCECRARVVDDGRLVAQGELTFALEPA